MTPDDVPEGPLLVDTDVFSYLRLRRGPYQQFEAFTQGRILALSFATAGEVLAGGHAAGLGEKRMNELRAAIRRFVIIPYSGAVTEAWAPLYAKLKGHLHQGGVNDLWTAACAITQTPPMPVVTNNLRDFRSISAESGLVVVHPDT